MCAAGREVSLVCGCGFRQNPAREAAVAATAISARVAAAPSMTVLPIVERELRVAARLAGTYWIRTAVAATALGLACIIYINTYRDRPSEIGASVFIGLAIIAGLFCLFAGTRATADCLSEEKRDGTLGLLFLTDLRGFDVVAGKLVAGSLNTFYGLIAVLPMLALPLLLGGVSAGQFWRVALVLLNTLFFSLAAGMIASALTKSARNAAGLCALLVLALAAFFPLAALIYMASYNLSNPPMILFVPSPGCALALAFDDLYPSHSGEFLLSLLITHSLAWIFLIATCFIVPRSWQDKAATVAQLRWRDRWLRWSLGDSGERARFRARLLDRNAFYWLCSRSRIKPANVWAVLGLLGCGWIFGWFKLKSDWTNWPIYIMSALILNTVLKGWFATETSSQLAEDRRTGALELLLSTPLNVQEIVRGQFLALCRQFLWPLVAVVTAEVAFLVAGIQAYRYDRDSMALMWICGLTVLFADLAALFYLGLWKSLTARSANRANSGAIVQIMALPWILWLVTIIFWNFFSRLTGIYGGSSLNVLVLVWTGISLAVSAFFGLRARARLLAQFREVATTRYTKPVSLWRRWFGAKHTAPS
jgi:ABC-type Na+ efflux pump permease subunit